jgi:hypothetical protein
MNHSLDVQLNLKNDTLRRRYDGLKYDIKKIEEGICEAFSLTFDLPYHSFAVVYDVSLRRLASSQSVPSTTQ